MPMLKVVIFAVRPAWRLEATESNGTEAAGSLSSLGKTSSPDLTVETSPLHSKPLNERYGLFSSVDLPSVIESSASDSQHPIFPAECACFESGSRVIEGRTTQAFARTLHRVPRTRKRWRRLHWRTIRSVVESRRTHRGESWLQRCRVFPEPFSDWNGWRRGGLCL